MSYPQIKLSLQHSLSDILKIEPKSLRPHFKELVITKCEKTKKEILFFPLINMLCLITQKVLKIDKIINARIKLHINFFSAGPL